MKSISVIWSLFVELIRSIKTFIYNNMGVFADILSLWIMPYFMLYLGGKLTISRGGIYIGSELFLPILINLISYVMNGYLSKTKSTSIPVPNERFTIVFNDEDLELGEEVVVKKGRLNEMIIYVAQLEDWLEKKGLL